MKQKITNTILHFNNFLKRNNYSDDDNNVKMMKLLHMVYYIYVDLSFGKTCKHIHSKTTTEIQASRTVLYETDTLPTIQIYSSISFFSISPD